MNLNPFDIIALCSVAYMVFVLGAWLLRILKKRPRTESFDPLSYSDILFEAGNRFEKGLVERAERSSKPIDFPIPDLVGHQFHETSTGRAWVWTGQAWALMAATPTAPAKPATKNCVNCGAPATSTTCAHCGTTH